MNLTEKMPLGHLGYSHFEEVENSRTVYPISVKQNKKDDFQGLKNNSISEGKRLSERKIIRFT